MIALARAVWIPAGMASAVLAFGFLSNQHQAAALLAAIPGVVWIVRQQLRWHFGSSLIFSLLTGLAVYAIWVGVYPIWALVSLIAGLTAWDLEHFMDRQRQAQRVDENEQLARQHLRRLAFLDGLSLILAGAVLLVHVHFSLGLALFLGLAAVLGISQLVRFLRQESD
ncbi:MAG: hypothetical protein ACM3PY_08280 [Omnitrophica WOR_2 bacterium]